LLKVRISFLTGVCVENDAISNAIRDEIRALRQDGVAHIRLYAFGCTQPDLPFHSVTGPEGVLFDPHFQSSDLIVFHFGIHYPLFDLLPMVPRFAKRLVVFHNVTPKQFLPTRLHKAIDKSFEQMSNILWADHVICDSATNLEVLRRQGIHTSASIFPLAVCFDERLPDEKPSFSDGRIRVAFVGRFTHAKGPHELIDALERVLESSRNVVFDLDLIGNLKFSLKDYVEGLCAAMDRLERQFGKRMRTCFHGDASEALKRKILRKADLFVLPTYHEGFCVPILEAYASGCRVIVYENSNTPTTSGGFATLVPTGDVDSLSTAIAKNALTVRSNRWTLGSGEGCYKTYADALRQYLKQFRPSEVEARFARFVRDWVENDQISPDLLAPMPPDVICLPVKNVSTITPKFLFNRPELSGRLTTWVRMGESEPCLGEGWHAPEYWPPRVRCIGKRARLYLKKPERWPAMLRIEAFYCNAGKDLTPTTLTVILWGRPVITQTFVESKWVEIECQLKGQDDKKPFLDVELVCDRVHIPDQWLHNGDTRELSFAIRNVSIEPLP
jgi:glycosyltransferase involved in cell wall biosynthesis